MSFGTLAMAQQPPASAPAPATASAPVSGIFHGTVADPTGALIPGSHITVNDASGHAVATATADSGGQYEVHGLAAGSYVIMANTDGFAPFASPAIVLAAGQSKRVDISMAIQLEQQSVVVTDDSPTVSVEADNNANALTIKGKDLEALSDDPDELQNELNALAGPSAGPNGGQIYIDGFTGGQLPPKSSIREIRVNQNPYSAEYDRLGFGRIEILTKPGTDQLHGQAMVQGNDSAFNTGNPYVPVIPGYYSYMYNGNVSGSVNKSTSFNVSIFHRTTNNEAYYDTACNALGDCGSFSGTLANPHSRTNFSPRFDFQFGQKNTLTVRYQYYHDSESGDISPTQLPTLSSSSTTNDNSLQMSDSYIINDHMVNETLFQYDRNVSSSSPVNVGPTISVEGLFTAGGNPSQFFRDHQDRWEMQNMTTMSAGKHAIKFGMRVRDTRDANYSSSGYNGTFIFANPTDYSAAVKAAIAGTTSTATPVQLFYSSGNTRSVTSNIFDGALFVQDDWKFSKKLTLSGGLRWETQNHVADHSDLSPRVAIAWALDGKGNKPSKTVLRVGYGIFYDRFGVGNLQTINRATLQEQNTLGAGQVTSSCFTASFNAFDPAACGTGSVNARTLYKVSPTYRSPYTQQLGVGLERQISKAATATITYLHSQGVHQLVQINTNAPYGPDYNAANGLLNEYLPEGVFRQDQIIVNGNVRLGQKFSVFGFYTFANANTDGAGGGQASNSFNLHQDYGRATFVSRNQVFLIGNYSGPWKISFNPFLIAQSGRPYNITDPTDVNGDSFFNDRPYVANANECSAGTSGFFQTQYGCLDTNANPLSGETLLASNIATGPAAVAVNLRISRSFGVGPKATGGSNAGGPPGGGPPGGGRGGRGGGPGGGFGPGGFGGGPGGGPGGMFGGQGANRKYNLNFSVQALNLFNNIDRGTPIGTLGTQNFGQSPSLQGGIFSSGSAARRIFAQVNFNF